MQQLSIFDLLSEPKQNLSVYPEDLEKALNEFKSRVKEQKKLVWFQENRKYGFAFYREYKSPEGKQLFQNSVLCVEPYPNQYEWQKPNETYGSITTGNSDIGSSKSMSQVNSGFQGALTTDRAIEFINHIEIGGTVTNETLGDED